MEVRLTYDKVAKTVTYERRAVAVGKALPSSLWVDLTIDGDCVIFYDTATKTVQVVPMPSIPSTWVFATYIDTPSVKALP